LDENREWQTVTIRLPVDAIDDLKRVARVYGMSNYQALTHFYVCRALRDDLERIWESEQSKKLEATLTEIGLTQEQISRIYELLPVPHTPVHVSEADQTD